LVDLFKMIYHSSDGSVTRCWHEPDDGQERRPDGPARLPGLGMVTGNGKTNFLSGLETSVWLKRKVNLIDLN
jgi:hypothetical protein